MNSNAFVSTISPVELNNNELANLKLYCHKHFQQQPMKFKKLQRQALLKRYDIAYYECSKCNCRKRVFEKPQLFDKKTEGLDIVTEPC